MIDYLKKNHLSLLIIGYLVVTGLFYSNSPIAQNVVEDIKAGAVTARTTITNPWTFQEPITTTATTTNSSGCFIDNGSDICTVTYTFADATTTLVDVLNPWWGTATTTVLSAIINIDGAASSSMTLALGTSTPSSASGNPLNCSTGTVPAACDGVIIDDAVVATSTAATGLNGEGSYATIVGTGGSFLNLSNVTISTGSSISPLVIEPNEKLTLVSTSTTPRTGASGVPAFFNCETGSCADGGSDGITNTGNTFSGSLTVTYKKP